MIKRGWWWALQLMALFGLTAAQAAPLTPAELPPALRDWLPWAQHGFEEERCPAAQGDGTRTCVWPAQLQLQVSAQGARFRYELQVYGAATRVRLPGEPAIWPQGLRLNGQPLAVLEHESSPSSLLPPGRHLIEGEFSWRQLPQDLQLPPGVALLQLSMDGQAVRRQADAQGRLWLRAAPDAAQAPSGDSATVRTLRLIEDGIPMQMTTQFVLVIAGKPRELLLPLALLPGWQPAQVDAPLPVRLQDDGSLRVQARPGTWTLQVQSRSLQSLQQLTLPKGGISSDEVWAFAAQNALRGITLGGAAAIDPRQVEMPEDWRKHPAFRLAGGDSLSFKENRRGSAAPEADSLQLTRTLWLDFDGGGFTVQDRFNGNFHRSTRLSMLAPGVLGRASVDGQDQLITQLDKGEQGFELRQTQAMVLADSRVESGTRSLSAVGWKLDVEGARAELRLPPGWQLLHAAGVDRVDGSWVAGWTLWDLFFLLLAFVAAGRIAGWRKGALLGLALLAAWQLTGSPPTWLWLLLLGLMALQTALPLQPGSSERRAKAVAWMARLRWSVVGLMALLLLPFAVNQVRLALYPSLERPWQTVGVALPSEAAATDAAATPEVQAVQSPIETKVVEAVAKQRALVQSSRYDSSKPVNEIDPKARVQTGPGLPNWQWRSHNLQWQGPVQASQQLQLWLLPPWASALWRLLSLGLLVAALWQLAQHGRPRTGAGRWFGAAALAAAAVASPGV